MPLPWWSWNPRCKTTFSVGWSSPGSVPSRPKGPAAGGAEHLRQSLVLPLRRGIKYAMLAKKVPN